MISVSFGSQMEVSITNWVQALGVGTSPTAPIGAAPDGFEAVFQMFQSGAPPGVAPPNKESEAGAAILEPNAGTQELDLLPNQQETQPISPLPGFPAMLPILTLAANDAPSVQAAIDHTPIPAVQDRSTLGELRVAAAQPWFAGRVAAEPTWTGVSLLQPSAPTLSGLPDPSANPEPVTSVASTPQTAHHPVVDSFAAPFDSRAQAAPADLVAPMRSETLSAKPVIEAHSNVKPATLPVSDEIATEVSVVKQTSVPLDLTQSAVALASRSGVDQLAPKDTAQASTHPALSAAPDSATAVKGPEKLARSESAGQAQEDAGSALDADTSDLGTSQSKSSQADSAQDSNLRTAMGSDGKKTEGEPVSKLEHARQAEPSLGAVQRREVIRQVARRMEMLAAIRSTETVVVRLDPKELGTIILSVQSREGHIDAQITASSDQVRQALEQSGAQLHRALEARGLTLGQMNVGSESAPHGQPQGRPADQPAPSRTQTSSFRDPQISMEANRHLVRKSDGVDLWI